MENEQTELEAKVLEILGRFSSLYFSTLKDLALAGTYSLAREQALHSALESLLRRGAISSGGRWGPFRIPQPPAKNGDRRPLSRLRVGKSR